VTKPAHCPIFRIGFLNQCNSLLRAHLSGRKAISRFEGQHLPHNWWDERPWRDAFLGIDGAIRAAAMIRTNGFYGSAAGTSMARTNGGSQFTKRTELQLRGKNSPRIYEYEIA
jgi:hypothetical protein